MGAIVAVLAALLQLGGRLLAPHLARLEAPLNAWLAPSGIRIYGLRGEWHGFNPAVAAEGMTFPGGELNDVAVELDVGESLWRNRIVARRLKIASGNVRFVDTPTGWRLEGARQAPGMDVASFFQHSDEVRMRSRIELIGERGTVSLQAQAQGVNRDGRNRWRAELRPLGCGECSLAAHFDIHAGRSAHDLEGAVRIDAANLAIDGALAAALGLPEVTLDAAMAWRGDGRTARASINAQAVRAQLPGGATTLSVAALARGRNGFYRGKMSFDGAVEDTALTAGMNVAANVDGALTLWADALDLGAWNAFLAAALGADGPVGRWFHGVAAAGSVRNFQLHVDAEGIAYAGQLTGVSTSSYRGVPEFRQVDGTLSGHLRAARIDFESAEALAALPDHFEEAWPYDHAAGSVTLWFEPRFLGLRARLQTRLGEARSTAGLALTRPQDPLEGRLAVFAQVDRAAVLDARRYIPRKLPGNLKPWLDASLVGGRLDDAAIVYHGHTRTLPGLPMRRLELDGLVADGALAYHPYWPQAEQLHGRLKVSGRAVRASGLRGVAFGAAFADVEVDVPADGDHASIRGTTQVDAQRALDFAHATPTAAFAPWLCDCWSGAGPVQVSGNLRVPLHGLTGKALVPIADARDLRERSGLEGADVDLRFELLGTTLNFPDRGVGFEGLQGAARFVTPHHLTAERLQGVLFGAPVTVRATSSDEAVAVEFSGVSRVEDVYGLLGTPELQVAAGAFDFTARLEVPMTERPATLDLASDGVGLALHLSAPLGKDAATPRPLRAKLTFSDDYVRTELLEGGAAGWLHVREGEVLAGAVGLGAPPPSKALANGVALTGRLEALDLEGMADFKALPVALRLNDFALSRLGVGGLDLHTLRLDGLLAPDAVNLGLRSDEVEGTLQRNGEGPWRVNLSSVRLPAGEAGVDPLDVSLMGHVPAADVAIEHVLVDGQDYGEWRFGVRPGPNALRLTGVQGEIRGLRVQAEEDVLWKGDEDASFFRGSVSAGDLAAVLPQWGYGANVESAKARIEGGASWPGSPLNFELEDLSGDLRITVSDGRFLDVEEASAGRFLALLNFSKLAHRLQFDFSDVFGQGIGFDSIRARAAFDDGLLHFREPMEIRGAGSAFKIYGTVDFADGSLDNDMIVTLPLSASLPWYAIWVASANPATAAGVLLGRQVFKEQIAALSSARYRVTGVIENPEPKFVGIFTGDLDAPGAGEGIAEEGTNE